MPEGTTNVQHTHRLALLRGDPEAIQFRIDRIDQALTEVGDKARWLSLNPVGKNYDVRGYKRIIPVVVTPFVEYIPSLNHRDWLDESLPRVLTPSELNEAMESCTNRVA